ncbi:Uncharacterised protein [Streptococcus pneumoniae]|nr:Uncharacterised protein [Streptococcus pneumoniae]
MLFFTLSNSVLKASTEVTNEPLVSPLPVEPSSATNLPASVAALVMSAATAPVSAVPLPAVEPVSAIVKLAIFKAVVEVSAKLI